MRTIRSTSSHYIRCMKANPRNEPGWIDRQTVVDQLRYGGVLEAVRVARVGYPIIMQPVAFLGRYRTLVDDSALPLPRKLDAPPDPMELKLCCEMIVERMHINADDLQVPARAASACRDGGG